MRHRGPRGAQTTVHSTSASVEVAQRQSDCMKVLPSCLRGLEAWTSSGYHRKSNHIAHLSRLVVQVESVAWDGCTPRCWLVPGTRRVRAYHERACEQKLGYLIKYATCRAQIPDCVPYITRGVRATCTARAGCLTTEQLPLLSQSLRDYL